MAFYPYRGETKVRYFPKTASTALSANGAVALSSGQLIKATTTSTINPGVILREVTSASSDYASTTMCAVIVPMPDTEFLIDVITGTATAALVGTDVDFASGGLGVDVGTSTHNQVTITGFVSASKVIGKINSNVDYAQAS